MYLTVKVLFKVALQKNTYFWLILGPFWNQASVMQLIILSFYPKGFDIWLD